MSDLAAKLAVARAEARVLPIHEGAGTVTSVAEAYRVQDALAAAFGAVWAWKVSALIPEQQRGYPTDRPVGGALFSPFVLSSPARTELRRFVAPLLECEIAFLLGRDLPPRDNPYIRAEIANAVEALVPAIEIADCRWPADAPDLLKLADDMGNGAFITGTPLRDWQSIDLNGRDVAFDTPVDADEDERPSPAAFLIDHAADPYMAAETESEEESSLEALHRGLVRLDERSRDIIQRRWLKDDAKATLQELADEYGVSAERIRQIEANAMKKMRAMFVA